MSLNENELFHGARPLHPIHRKARRIKNRITGRRLARGVGFDWDKGYDVRDIIGAIPIKNQGASSSCGGQAGAYFLEIQRKLQSVKEGDISAKSIYAPIAYPGGGTTITSLIQQVGTEGANLESTVPSYYTTGDPLSEAMMIEKSWMNDTTTKDALMRAGYTPYDIPDTIDDIALAIQNYGACIWEIAGQNNGTWLSDNPKPPSSDNQNNIWHHFMCLIGAKIWNGKKVIIALNSWGTSIGDLGIQYFDESYFNGGIVDAFTLIYDLHLVPASDNHSIWAELNRWFRVLLLEMKPS